MAFSFALIPMIIIVLLVLLVATSKSGSNQGGEDMIKNVYIYLVLFATLMMTIGGSVAVFMAVADIVAPAPYYQSYEDYKRWGYPEAKEGVVPSTLTEEELRAGYESMILVHRENEVIRAKNSLIKSFGWIVIPLPIFIYFQRRLNRKTE